MRTAASASEWAPSLSFAAVRLLLTVFGARFNRRAISLRAKPEAKSSSVRRSNAVSVLDGANPWSLDRASTRVATNLLPKYLAPSLIQVCEERKQSSNACQVTIT